MDLAGPGMGAGGGYGGPETGRGEGRGEVGDVGRGETESGGGGEVGGVDGGPALARDGRRDVSGDVDEVVVEKDRAIDEGRIGREERGRKEELESGAVVR